jgi:Condensin II complex subunit CAP-H2 or CNDH2, C-term
MLDFQRCFFEMTLTIVLLSMSESNVGKTFEELCRAHIRAFAKGAEDFAFSTKLTERVSIWQAKLAPILEDEEQRAAFDIHRYSQELLETAKQGLQGIKRKSDGSEYVSLVEIFCRSYSKIVFEDNPMLTSG